MAKTGESTKLGDFPDLKEEKWQGFDSTFRFTADGATAIMTIGKACAATTRCCDDVPCWSVLLMLTLLLELCGRVVLLSLRSSPSSPPSSSSSSSSPSSFVLVHHRLHHDHVAVATSATTEISRP